LAIPTQGVAPDEVANGVDTHTVEVTVRDGDLNAVAGQVAKVVITAPDATSQTLQTAASNAAGVASLKFSAVKAGDYTVRAYLTRNGIDFEVSLSPQTASFVSGPAAPGKEDIAVDKAKTQADGKDEVTITVTLRDANGNLVGRGGDIVTLSSTLGSPTPAVDNGDGTYTAKLRSTVAGLATFNFRLNGAVSPKQANTTFVKTPTTPEVEYANDHEVVGTLPKEDAGDEIVVTLPDGTEVCRTVVKADGSYMCAPLQPKPKDGDDLIVTHEDPDTGFKSDPIVVEVDATPPSKPVVDPSNGSEVTGHTDPGEAGSKVEVIDDKTGNVICTAVVRPDGTFSCKPLYPPKDGDKLDVVVVDPSNNRSDPEQIVVDTVPPSKPVVDPSDGSAIYGETDEPFAKIDVKDGNGKTVCTTTADSTGAFVCVPPTKLPDGTELVVTATDPAGNVSPETRITVDQSKTPPPRVNPTNGQEVTGSGVPGAKVEVQFPNGKTETVLVGPDGKWHVDAPAGYTPKDGDKLKVTQIEEFNRGQERRSDPITVTVDASAPDAPKVNPSDGTTITGTGEPGASVTITDSTGNVIGKATVDKDGSWIARLDPEALPGETVSVTQTDKAGNVSAPTVLRIGLPKVIVTVGTLSVGDEQTAEITNMQPNEIGTLTQYSDDPYSIGKFIADKNGSATVTWTIPSSTSVGTHHVEANGPVSGTFASNDFEVVAPQADVDEFDEDITPAPNPTVTTPGPTVTEYSTGTHPKTGAEGLLPAIGGALGALLAGLLLILAAAKRRREEEESGL
jgi:hypothetical protein